MKKLAAGGLLLSASFINNSAFKYIWFYWNERNASYLTTIFFSSSFSQKHRLYNKGIQYGEVEEV